MANPYEIQVKKLNDYRMFFSEIEDESLSLMLTIMMPEKLENDPWLNTKIRAGLKRSITTLMTYINSIYQITFHDDLFANDKIGDVEEFKIFARELRRYSIILQDVMESVDTEDA